MDLQTAAVDYRIAELRDIARSLHWERTRRSPGGWARAARIALGRRLVLAGVALLDGSAPRVSATPRVPAAPR